MPSSLPNPAPESRPSPDTDEFPPEFARVVSTSGCSGTDDKDEAFGARLRAALRPVEGEAGGLAGLSSKAFQVFGTVMSVSGLGIEIADELSVLEVGARVHVETSIGDLLAEVVGLQKGKALCLPFGDLTGVKRGARARFDGVAGVVVNDGWLGRVVDGLGRPVDGKAALSMSGVRRSVRAKAPVAALRARLGAPAAFGVRAIDAFTPARIGQRLGIFSGAGVGKSVLLSMIARNTECDVAVIALIGERGREVREFIEDSLGEEGLKRAVVIVATADEPAMIRREAALLAMTVAEHFRDQGKHVLCLVDSLTRVANAQREIGLAAGEPPTTKGYTPSVFSTLPALLERAGPGLEPGKGEAGAITGIFSVLVEGDNHDEPLADAARAILDGHIVLNRSIAERGRFPAVDILKSVSRTALSFDDPQTSATVRRARALAATYEDMREMIRIGAYNSGSSAEVDEAIEFHERIEAFLAQDPDDCSTLDEMHAQLLGILPR